MQSPQQVIALSASQYWQKTASLTLQLAQRLWYWYYNIEDKIIEYILYGQINLGANTDEVPVAGQGGLSKIFPKTYAYMTVKVFNIVGRVVDKLAFVYKNSPQRMLNGGKQSEVKGGEVVPIANQDDDRYQELLKKSTVEKKQGSWNALGKLFNTVLVQPIWVKDEKDEAKSYMDFLIHTPAWCVVETTATDWLKPKSFAYEVYLQLSPDRQPELVKIYWSETEHYIIDSHEDKHAIPGKGNGNEENTNMVNPYSILPVATLRFKDGIDFWGEGMWDLVNANQEICEEVTNLAYVAKTQAHGQMVILDPTNSVSGNLQTGVDHPIHIHSFQPGENPDVKYINANAALAPVQELIDWQIKTVQMMKGLSPQQYSLEAKDVSGVAKGYDATEIEEIRKNDMNVITMFESDLFDVTRIVYNYHNPKNKISMDAKFSIKFPEPKINESQTDKNARRRDALANYTASHLDFIMEDNPGMSREDAQKRFDQIVAERRKIKDELGLDELFNQDNPNEDNAPNNMMNNLRNNKQSVTDVTQELKQ